MQTLKEMGIRNVIFQSQLFERCQKNVLTYKSFRRTDPVERFLLYCDHSMRVGLTTGFADCLVKGSGRGNVEPSMKIKRDLAVC